MGLYANYPIALAPGMGLNACFAFTVVAAGIGPSLALIGLQNAGIRPGASKRSTPLLPSRPGLPVQADLGLG